MLLGDEKDIPSMFLDEILSIVEEEKYNGLMGGIWIIYLNLILIS